MREKHVASCRAPRKRRVLQGSSSRSTRHENEQAEVDPYYTPDLQAQRLSKFASRKATYIRYADMAWFTEQGFDFPMQLEAQGVTNFIELQGNIYPNLVREFYANFQYKDGYCMTMMRGILINLDKRLFLNVGGLVDDGYALADCSSEMWNDFDATEMYRSCLRAPHFYVQGELTKAGSLSVENRLLHYFIAYMLVQRKTNHAQPTVNDLKLMYAVKEGIMIDWTAEILKVMYHIATSSNKLLAYSVFISRIADYAGVDTSHELIQPLTTKDHLFDEGLIHKMGIYKLGGEWIYQDDYDPVVDLDLDDEEEDAAEVPPEQQQEEQPYDEPHEEQAPQFGLAHLDAMEQRLNERVDSRAQRIEDRIQLMEERMNQHFHDQEININSRIDHLSFMFNTFACFNQPPPPPPSDQN